MHFVSAKGKHWLPFVHHHLVLLDRVNNCMGDYLGKSPYRMPQGTRLVYFTPSTSATVPGLSFSRSHPDSGVSLQPPWFSFRPKINSQLKHIWLWCCAPRSYMASTAAARGTWYMLSTCSRRAAPFAIQPPGSSLCNTRDNLVNQSWISMWERVHQYLYHSLFHWPTEMKNHAL